MSVEALRAELREDASHARRQMWGAIAATGAVITATIALTKALL